jgi:hypothetical protein
MDSKVELKSVPDRRLPNTSVVVRPFVRQRSPSADSSPTQRVVGVTKSQVVSRVHTSVALQSNFSRPAQATMSTAAESRSSFGYNANTTRGQQPLTSPSTVRRQLSTVSSFRTKTETTVSLWPSSSQSRRTNVGTLAATKSSNTGNSTDGSLASGSTEFKLNQSDVSVLVFQLFEN